MKETFNKSELTLLKSIAKKANHVLTKETSGKKKVGYLQCLNSLAYACGYEDWQNLYSDHKILLAP